MTRQLEHAWQVLADAMVAETELCVGTDAEFMLHSLARAHRNAAHQLRTEREAREAKVARAEGDVTYHPKGKP